MIRRLLIFSILLTLSSFTFNAVNLSALAATLTDQDSGSLLNDTVWYKPSGGTSFAGDDFCLGGPGGSGPLYGPFFPQVSDTSALAKAIDDYIKNTVPDSPLVGLGNVFVGLGQKYNVNPVFILAIAKMETALATVGYGKPPKYNVGNIRGDSGDNTGFASYSGYPAGLEAIFKLIAGSNYLGDPTNYTTIAQIMNRYAPPSDDNDTNGYIKFIGDLMKKVYSTLSNPPSDPSGDTNCTPGGSIGSVNVNGYAFPVAPQKKSENGGVNGMSPLPCLSPTSCHHDGTPAFDISRQPGGDSVVGTPVYAISDGTISNAHIYMGISGCYSLQLHSSKDSYYYWYGHLQNLRVSNGDTVKAGQQVAEIGARKCTGNGADPHLHIDRGCVINNEPQLGGLEDCRDPGIIQLINGLYESLP